MPENGEGESGQSYCINCGNELAAGAKFCPECGAKITGGGMASTSDQSKKPGTKETVESPSETQSQAGSSNSMRKVGIIAGTLWGIILILFSLPFLFSGGSKQIIGALIGIAIGLLFIPPIRHQLGIGNLPGIKEHKPARRNAMIGIAYGIGGLFATEAAVLSTLSSTGSPSTQQAGGSNPDSDAGGGGSESEDTPTAESKDTPTEESEDTPTPEPYPDAWAHDPSTGLVLRDVEGTVKQYSTEITGTVKNVSGNDYDYVQLQFALYDETDAKVGDALANTSGLQDGQRWRFEAISVQTENVSTFGLEGTTAY